MKEERHNTNITQFVYIIDDEKWYVGLVEVKVLMEKLAKMRRSNFSN